MLYYCREITDITNKKEGVSKTSSFLLSKKKIIIFFYFTKLLFIICVYFNAGVTLCYFKIGITTTNSLDEIRNFAYS